MSKQFIRDITDKKPVSSYFAVWRRELRSTKNGDPFLQLELTDTSGTVIGRVWKDAGAQKLWEQMENDPKSWHVVSVEGTGDFYNERAGIIITSLQPKTNPELSDLVATIDENIDELFDRLMKYKDSIKDADIKKMCDVIFGDKDFTVLFKQCPAAKKLHDNKIGGLMKHVCNLTEIAISHCERYGKYIHINRDVVIAGCLLHDMGKVYSYTFKDFFIDSTDVDRLMGHISMGVAMLSKYQTAVQIPQKKFEHLSHIIISHHRHSKFGSPVHPATLEALIVYLSDLSDSLIINAAQEREQTQGWTRPYWTDGKAFFSGELTF